VPRGRRGRTAATLLCALLVGMVGYFGVGAVHSANSARSVVSPRHEALKPPRTARHSVVAARHEQARKRPSRLAATAAARPARYGIAFFGDSVSVGSGASDRHHTYVARVSNWLEMRGKKVSATVNAEGGVAIAYWEYAPMPKKLDAVVVELGTNDVRLRTPSAQFAQEYRTLVGRIRAANPNAQLLCLSVWPRRGGTRLEGVINAQIREACPGAYVDITRFRNRWGIRSSDGFHPNDAGYRLIAQAVESKLKARSASGHAGRRARRTRAVGPARLG
jgi:lysophospholipase L1-like esterase